MARPPRQNPPSAIDGYRRLARTRHAATEGVSDTEDASSATPTRVARTRRVAGAVRLAGFVAVVALIVGTSVSLAGTDGSRDAAKRASKKRPVVAHAVTSAHSTSKARLHPAQSATYTATKSLHVATSATPLTTGSHRALPFTGESRLQWPLLAGALLALCGMLLQIAGEPLPARAREHATR